MEDKRKREAEAEEKAAKKKADEDAKDLAWRKGETLGPKERKKPKKA